MSICSFAVFHREIISEMGELGVLGPTIKGKDKFLFALCSPGRVLESLFLSLTLGFPVCKTRLLSLC